MVTMKSDVPINLKKMEIKCKLSKIMFQQPADQVPDWDDRMRTVKWVDMPRSTPGTLTTKRKVSGTLITNLARPARPGRLVLSGVKSQISSFRGKKKNFPFHLTLIFQVAN